MPIKRTYHKFYPGNMMFDHGTCFFMLKSATRVVTIDGKGRCDLANSGKSKKKIFIFSGHSRIVIGIDEINFPFHEKLKSASKVLRAFFDMMKSSSC